MATNQNSKNRNLLALTNNTHASGYITLTTSYRHENSHPFPGLTTYDTYLNDNYTKKARFLRKILIPTLSPNINISKMKKTILLSIMALIVFSISSLAQINEVLSQDTIKNATTGETSNINQDTSSNKIKISKYSFHSLNQYGLPPIIVIDGKVSYYGLYCIEPKDVQSISVLRGENTASLYGVKNRAGVILVTTKKRANSIKVEEHSIKK